MAERRTSQRHAGENNARAYLLKGRRAEIEFINGHIVEKGAQIGIDAPCNAKIAALVKRVERQELPITIDNLRDV